MFIAIAINIVADVAITAGNCGLGLRTVPLAGAKCYA
jgi:hypothetical protein